jgi:hypothetical protein
MLDRRREIGYSDISRGVEIAQCPDAQVAQLVEQRIENPRVGGSNPPLGTIFRVLPTIKHLDSSS